MARNDPGSRTIKDRSGHTIWLDTSRGPALVQQSNRRGRAILLMLGGGGVSGSLHPLFASSLAARERILTVRLLRENNHFRGMCDRDELAFAEADLSIEALEQLGIDEAIIVGDTFGIDAAVTAAASFPGARAFLLMGDRAPDFLARAQADEGDSYDGSVKGELRNLLRSALRVEAVSSSSGQANAVQLLDELCQHVGREMIPAREWSTLCA